MAFSILSLVVIIYQYRRLTIVLRNLFLWFIKESFWVKLLLVSMGIAVTTGFLCSFYASLLPPHLSQEYDVLNYHLTMPRQHLLIGSFRHIPWSTADLFFLPVDFALAPFWLSTLLPNKLPQFFFIFGVLGVCGRLAWRFSNRGIWPPILMIFTILGSHNFGIQSGTAMLDVVICYLFLAAFDSFLNGAIWLGVVEFCFYFWSKPLIPVQFLVTLAIFALVLLFLWFLGIRKSAWVISDETIQKPAKSTKYIIKKGVYLFVILSLIIAGPFIFKSLHYSGTPIFPLKVGLFRTLSIPQSSETLAGLKEKAKQLLSVKDQYGSGRSMLEFVRHLWLIAVPEKGVNNRYDYPLGLMYLLFIGPFLFLFFHSLRNRILPFLPLWVIVSWAVWWMGTQQTRFLFVPLVLMYLAVVVTIKTPSRILLCSMFIAIMLVSLSVYRANKQDFGRWGYSVLRQKDKELIQMGNNTQFSKEIKLPFYDVAYATFPVSVENNHDSMFILRTEFGKGE